MSRAPKIAMQSRCIYCLHEQYAMAVALISRGQHPCVWCGRVPPQMTEPEYREALKAARLKGDRG